MGRKLVFAAVFADISRRGPLPEEASIHTAEMTAMRDIQKRVDMRWVIYTDLLSSMLAIENNRENHSVLNQIFELQQNSITRENRSQYVKSLHT